MSGSTILTLFATLAFMTTAQPGAVQLTVSRMHSDDDVTITISAAPGRWWAQSMKPDGRLALTNDEICPALTESLAALTRQRPAAFYLRGISPSVDGGRPPTHQPLYSISGVYGGDGEFGMVGLAPINGSLRVWARDFIDTVSNCETVINPQN